MELTPIGTFGEAIVGRRDTGDLGGASFLTDPYHFTTGFDIEKGNPTRLAVLDVNQIIVSTLPEKYAPCLVATTENITLSGLQTVDSVALVAGDRVVVKDQTTTTQNGIYYVQTGSWIRTGYPYESVNNGKYAKILSGNTYANQWAVTKTVTPYYSDTSELLFDILSESNVELFEHTNYFLRFKNIGTPTRTYFYSVTSGGSIKAATTANITLSGLQTVDGVALVANDSVLVKNQSAGVSGVYAVKSGAWTLIATTFYNKFYFVVSGTVNGGKTFVSTIAAPATMLHLSMILYPTLEDATNETNPIIPLYTTKFIVHWIYKSYGISECIELGAADVEDIFCCPKPGITNFAINATITKTYPEPGPQTVTLTPARAYPDSAGAPYIYWYLPGSVKYFEKRGPTIGDPITTYSFDGSTLTYTYWLFGEYTADVNKVIRFFDLVSVANPEPPYSTTLVERSGWWNGYTSETWNISFSSAFVIPDLTLSMTGAKFVTEVDDIPLGDISITLTYDTATGYWFGPLENYYNIPGRIHARRLNGHGVAYCAAGMVSVSPEQSFSFYCTDTGDLFLPASSMSGQRFRIRYSSYKRARKGNNFDYDYLLYYYASAYDAPTNQAHNFFNSNRYWIESTNATLTAGTPP